MRDLQKKKYFNEDSQLLTHEIRNKIKKISYAFFYSSSNHTNFARKTTQIHEKDTSNSS